MNFIDLKTPYLQNKKSIDEAVLRVVASTQYIGNYDDPNSEVSQFSRELEAAVGVAHAIPCNSGTTALLLAFLSIGLNSTNEVIFPSFNFIAGPEIALLLGAKPVFVDVSRSTCMIDLDSLRSKINYQTRVIVVSNLFGQIPDYDAIREIMLEKGMGLNTFLIEDAAQSFGAKHRGKMGGSFGDISITSFYPAKPFGGIGEGGAVFTGDHRIAKRVVAILNHGSRQKYIHIMKGINGRMDSIQAAVLRVKLPLLKKELERRREIANHYLEYLDLSVNYLPKVVTDEPSWAQFTVTVPARDAVQKRLRAKGVPTAIHYPIPCHSQEVFKTSYIDSYQKDFPGTNWLCERVLSLPLHPFLTEEEIKTILYEVYVAVQKKGDTV